MYFYLWNTMLNHITNFRFQKYSDLIVSNSLFDFKRFYDCKSIGCENLYFKNIAGVDTVCRFTNKLQL
jgi:hypothetical protein